MHLAKKTANETISEPSLTRRHPDAGSGFGQLAKCEQISDFSRISAIFAHAPRGGQKGVPGDKIVGECQAKVSTLSGADFLNLVDDGANESFVCELG